jgi:enamine deaminase RidA (YjgF/YER057c/UK114 family)
MNAPPSAVETTAAPLLFRSAAAADAAHDAPQVLGTVGLGATPPRHTNGAPAVAVQVRQLPGMPAAFETWCARGVVVAGTLGPVSYASDGELLFGCVELDEDAHAGGLQDCAQRAYAAIFDVLDRCGCPHPLRFWNYVPHINAVSGELERYRQFNIGRQQAFLAAGRPAFDGAPAACAIGTHGGRLSVHFLAANRAPIPLENPRQVSAYRYPTDYGPRPPTFSRAALADLGAPVLFISGTAAIVGHRSMHAGDAAAQTRETFVNLRTLLDVANARLGAPVFSLERLAYTVYVRRAADADIVRAQFEAAVGRQTPAARDAAYARADICRAELLVEIEATGVGAPAR